MSAAQAAAVSQTASGQRRRSPGAVTRTRPQTNNTVKSATRSYWRVSTEMLTTAGLSAHASTTSDDSSRSKPRTRASPNRASIVSRAKMRLSAGPAQWCMPVSISHRWSR